ncbi:MULTISPECIES: biotin/lipoyl-containing protein [Crateriforma]|uniref:Glutaconyl-CoA decarboxylase subunit gamma n=1 Tax=Crateriforma conspicua TaxID=2527996 RepID=A0A5C5Y5F5_9PLAN|nr:MULTISPECIES: biotin/lipoyl-containing protein [Crateriforma]QDV64762.1 Glutaconyl-CoA decarboxylase subunit gamma [Crateriforma conspicua]TWT70159.1 Glutaconyl-CoA decarboxylase subunit gamma [Crateriforma conspicua]TWU65863.1 Glutaconyl-CoA decarboxylase subunit gamma [Crateriforma conspicua]
MKKMRITVGDKSYEVTVEHLEDDDAVAGAPQPAGPRPVSPVAPVQKAAAPSPKVTLAAGAITSPMAGVVLSVAVKENDSVDQNDVLLVLEAMKMENQIIAPAGAKVKAVHVKAGESVQEGQLLVELE